MMEKIPSLVEETGSLFTLVVTYAFMLSFSFGGGQAIGNVPLVLVGSVGGSFLGVAYFLWKPLKLFWDNAHAPKPFSELTPGELRALGFLNSWKGRWAVLKYISAVPATATLGALLSSRGYVFIVENPPREAAWDDPVFLINMTVVSGLLSLVVYIPSVARVVLTRWEWIQTHQPLASGKVLAKYAHRSGEVGRWENLYGTEFPEEMERAMKGRPGIGFLKMILQILGGGTAALVLFRLISGGVLEERRVGAFVILAVGLLVYWLAGKFLGGGDSGDG
ncbi:MAG TPA: hypothetical protein P5300_10690 [Acidobacteriota bacterium]|nr:hypothetical protein [Acidobacteriota bacterium]